jgi:hypothetical protein
MQFNSDVARAAKYPALVNPNVPDATDRVKIMANLLKHSQKFMLPYSGIVFEDEYFNAIGEELRLPYPIVALEYESLVTFSSHGGEGEVRNVVIAAEIDEAIHITRCIEGIPNKKGWCVSDEFMVKKTDLERHNKQLSCVVNAPYADKKELDLNQMQSLAVLLSFLNVLQCSNVHTERLQPKKTFVGQGAKRGDVIPFDSYHILSIDNKEHNKDTQQHGGTHRSPREHLRRGHIRRLQDGRCIWINSVVVNPGIGYSVRKDYEL